MDKLTPGEAIRKYCLECTGKSYNDITNCELKNCMLYKFRLGKGRPSVKIVNKFCRECMGAGFNGSGTVVKLVRDCSSFDCKLHSFRNGKNPNYPTDSKPFPEYSIKR